MRPTWTSCQTSHQFLHYTAKILQKACFEFWRKTKSEDDSHCWSSQSQVELQDWFYKYQYLLRGMVSDDYKVKLGNLLSWAKELRNADCHRKYEGPTEISQWHGRAVRLLSLLDETEDLLHLNLAGHFIHASRATLHKQNLCYYGPDVDWKTNQALASNLSYHWRWFNGHDQYRTPIQRSLHETFQEAATRFFRHDTLGLETYLPLTTQIDLRFYAWEMEWFQKFYDTRRRFLDELEWDEKDDLHRNFESLGRAENTLRSTRSLRSAIQSPHGDEQETLSIDAKDLSDSEATEGLSDSEATEGDCRSENLNRLEDQRNKTAEVDSQRDEAIEDEGRSDSEATKIDDQPNEEMSEDQDRDQDGEMGYMKDYCRIILERTIWL